MSKMNKQNEKIQNKKCNYANVEWLGYMPFIQGIKVQKISKKKKEN